jgi:acetyl-CoA carboxylase carboxyltransferase component
LKTAEARQSKRIDSQHSKGKLSARERITLVDDGILRSLTPSSPNAASISVWKDPPLPGDGVVTGWPAHAKFMCILRISLFWWIASATHAADYQNHGWRCRTVRQLLRLTTARRRTKKAHVRRVCENLST